MAQTDVFALKNSGLETFLFAEVGDELNGSTLTVLSVLARLGLDPWVEAARLVDLPRRAAVDSISRYIALMPLSPRVLAEGYATATRLAVLLPVNNAAPRPATGGAPQGMIGVPKWLPMTLLCCALALGLGVSMVTAPRPDTAAPATQVPTAP